MAVSPQGPFWTIFVPKQTKLWGQSQIVDICESLYVGTFSRQAQNRPRPYKCTVTAMDGENSTTFQLFAINMLALMHMDSAVKKL